ncbi:MAG: SGNH/GDSL hydrolase family protein [Nanoarchaeota archaeon]|nr:SGNH/GDSL hydrolase family protein [Nanoarchaeota archaeon]
MRKKIVVSIITVLLFFMALELGGRLIENNNFQTTVTWQKDSNLHKTSTDNELLYEMKPNKNVTWMFTPIQTNSKGIRDYEYEIPKPNNICRILILGDSITFGLYLPLNETYSKKLEQLLNLNEQTKRFEVINAGVTGYNTVQEFNLLKNKLMEYEPDLVILGFFLNDFDYSWKLVRKKNEIHLMVPKQQLATPIIINLPTKINLFFLKNSFSYRYLNLKLSVIIKRFQPNYTINNYFKPYKQPTESTIKDMKQFLQEKNISFLMLIFPLLEGTPPDSTFILFQDAVEIPNNLNISYINILDEYKNRTNYLFTLRVLNNDIYHPNEYGNTIISESIYEFLQKEQMC